MQQRSNWRLTPELVLALAAIIIAVYALLGEHGVREVVTIKETADATSMATPPGSFREAAAKARRSVQLPAITFADSDTRRQASSSA